MSREYVITVRRDGDFAVEKETWTPCNPPSYHIHTFAISGILFSVEIDPKVGKEVGIKRGGIVARGIVDGTFILPKYRTEMPADRGSKQRSLRHIFDKKGL